MIGIYLMPWPVRGVRAPYLWIYYKWLTHLAEPALFVIGRDYLRSPQQFAADGRWELDPVRMSDNGYRAPLASVDLAHRTESLPDELFDDLLEQSRGNPVALFRRMLTERIPDLEAALEHAVSRHVDEGIDTLVTWCNCPSLNAVAARHGIPVTHLEVGPLRAPLWRPTAYLDFRGVNGNTEAADRHAALPPCLRAPSLEALRRFFFRQPLPEKTGEARIGVVLQVDDDSNLVAFGNGFDNQATLIRARLDYAGQGVVTVRAHPGSPFALRPNWFEIDHSYDSLAFIRRCAAVLTVNSSLALEAMILDTPTRMLGDCSFAFVNVADDPQRLSRLAWYLFAYLIPESLQFDPDYVRFRLAGPSEAQIVCRHAREWLPDVPVAIDTDDVWQAIDGVLRAAMSE